MSDNTKNGIIDLTEIVEMGTPPDPAANNTIPASPAGTVDFESELEDLFNTTDFSELADSADSSSQPVEQSADLFADTPKNEPAAEDLLADLAPEMSAPTQSGGSAVDSAPSFESDLDDLLDSVDAKDSSVGFDADFEDLLNEFSESPASKKEPVRQPDFDEDLSSMSMNPATPESVVAEPAPQPQAVASEPLAATEANIADVNAADVDDLFADLDFELGEAPAEPAHLAPAEEPKVQPADDLDDLFADFDFETAPVEDPVPKPKSAPSAPQGGADDDLLGDLGLDFDLDEPDTKQVQELKVQSAPEPAPATEKNIADINNTDVDDLFADLDFELGEAPVEASVEPEPQPVVSPAAPAKSTPVEDVSLEDPFDIDGILNESSDDTPSPAQEAQGDFDLADLDELLKVDDEPAQAPRTDLTAADGTTLESEEVEMDDIGFLLSELDENDGAQTVVEAVQEPVVEPEAEIAPEVAFEPDSPVEAVVPEIKEPVAPVDGSMFDAEIDALLDDLEMAAAEPATPIPSEPQVEPVLEPEPVGVVPEPAEEIEEVTLSVESESNSEVQDDDLDLDALLDDLEMVAAEPAAPISSEPQVEPVLEPEQEVVEPEPAELTKDALLSAEPVNTGEFPEDDLDLDALLEDDLLGVAETSETAPEVDAASPIVEDELTAELDALLNDDTLGVSDAPDTQEDASPLGSADEFESILDELDSLLDEQEALEPVMEADSEDPVDELFATPVEDVLQDAVGLDFESDVVEPEIAVAESPESEPMTEVQSIEGPTVEPEAELLGEPTSLEEDLDSTLDRILGEEPLGGDVVGDVTEDDLQPAVEPAEFTHDDIDTLFSDADAPESVMEEVPEGEQDLSFEAPVEEPISEDVSMMAEPSIESSQELAAEPEVVAPEHLDLSDPTAGAALHDNVDEPVFAAPEELAEPFGQVAEDSDPVSEAMDAVEQEVPMAELEQEAMADLESFADLQPEPVEAPEEEDAPELDMVDINENAAPVPPNASLEDLMRESSVAAPDFADSSMEMLDTTPAVSSAVQHDDSYDVPPVPAMTPEEFAELTERIYYLESTLQNVVVMQESFAASQPAAVDKEVMKEAIDDAFNLDGPLMARVLNAVEVRTEMMIESMGNRIEGQIKGTIEQSAAKSAAQVIREELKALLAEDFS
ncbi:midas domain-containing protein [Halodesulfovibrio marinisediminis]|uniref:Uncharacterized protein n=1 Tax=Halodesulfovibrio marinisediminis DSM 17456 TaxID=1121457 RepID=A0A1N6F3W9_9BACT|nr:hypothetical protein [Halodesulfovibrio marinisediminis]SIN89904.1 hypothetical protein SAMN02745161_1080 [Halodesulfovibrio marinisediminis DSM 17456]